MEQKTYLIVIDTTESTVIRNMPRGILNTYIVKAINEHYAKEFVMRTMNPRIASQLESSFYIYPLDYIINNLNKIVEIGGKNLPIFSFMPLNGQRPPKVMTIVEQNAKPKLVDEDITNIPIDDKPIIIDAPKTTKVVEQRVIPPKPILPKDLRGNRSRDFHKQEHVSMGQTSDTLSPDQAQLISALGITTTKSEVTDEGVNARINNSTGQNHNISRSPVNKGPSNTLSPDKAELIRNLVNNQPIVVEEAVEYDDVPQIEPDSSLMELPPDEGIVDVNQLEKELSEHIQKTGFKVENSKPGKIPTPEVSKPLESNVDSKIKAKVKGNK